MNKWKEIQIETKKNAKKLGDLNKSVVTAYQGLKEAVDKDDVLSTATKELIALAVAVTTRCEGCIASHSQAAIKAGATKEEVAAALGVAIALNAGAAYVYSTRVIDALDMDA